MTEATENDDKVKVKVTFKVYVPGILGRLAVEQHLEFSSVRDLAQVLDGVEEQRQIVEQSAVAKVTHVELMGLSSD